MSVDTLRIDVIADTIPVSNPAIATSFKFNFPTPNMILTQTALPYATAHAWNIFDLSDTPQSDGQFEHGVLDINAAGTIGSGTIGTLTLETMPGVATGTFPLTLTEAAHVDTGGTAHLSDVIGNAAVGINQGCTLWGDHNCSGSVTPVDALLTLRFDAGLSTNTGACPDFGQVVEVLDASPHLWGDVDCSATISPIDALKVLRFDAGLSVSQAGGCPGMGTSIIVIE
jgi:hypothetical protein